DLTCHHNLAIQPFWQYVMGSVMALVSLLMMSRVIYPSFKHVNFEKRGTITAILLVVAAICAFVCFPWIAPAIIFLCYLGYGLIIRPFLTRRMRRAIEVYDDEDEDEEESPENQG
ncbi:MAG: hypothetical protein IJY72_04745, partial [Akkermansia sp.]|nr:hypothetical protein [Akkermansia sp.]